MLKSFSFIRHELISSYSAIEAIRRQEEEDAESENEKKDKS